MKVIHLEYIVLKNKRKPHSGVLIGIYGNENQRFKLGICLDVDRAVIIYDQDGVKDIVINNLIKLVNGGFELRDLCFDLDKSEVKLEGEVYAINLYTTPKKYDKTLEEFFHILILNLTEIKRFNIGEIIKFEGFKLNNKPVYHHHAIYTDNQRLKIIHKTGEPNPGEIVVNMSGFGMTGVEVSEDNLLEIANCRRISKELTLEEEYIRKKQVRSPEETVAEAKKLLGKSKYSITFDNCQHFCTYCRYGEKRSLEIEEATKAVAIGGSLFALVGLGLYMFTKTKEKNRKRKEKEKEAQLAIV